MDADTIRAKMEEAVKEATRSSLARVFGWTFDVDASTCTVYVRLRHRRRQHSPYLLRIIFDDFPQRAPSYVFVNPDSKQETPAAWPPGVGHDNQPRICTPGTREFHEQLHHGDAQYPWDPDRYSFLQTITEIHRLMEAGMGS